MTRRIAFEGIENFRDFGDYPAVGGRLKKGLLYRSAHHAEATDADLEALAGLGVRLVADLRRRDERQLEPSRRWPGFAAEVIESDLGEDVADAWRAFLQASDLSEDSFRTMMLKSYRTAPFRAAHLELFSRWFRAVADGDGAALVHCAAGKDRTGLLCALTHYVAGVHEDDIVEDYLLTNDMERLSRRAAIMCAGIERHLGRRPTEQAALVAIGVDAAYLQVGLSAIREAHGSIDSYLETALGVDAPLRERVRERLLA